LSKPWTIASADLPSLGSPSAHPAAPNPAARRKLRLVIIMLFS
jgi:hypothetical protein